MPPVSSRTTIMSTPFSTSGRSVEAPSSLSLTATGRRFAYRPSPLRMASSPCSGRTLPRGSSHFGPPTAPSSTASAPRADSRVASGSAVPVASMAAPPIRASRVSNSWPKRLATADRTFKASLVTSGPIPSPGRTVMTARMGRGLYPAIKSSQGGGPGISPLTAALAAPRLRYRHASSRTERLARDLQSRRHLAALVLAGADAADHVAHHRGVDPGGDQGVAVQTTLQGRLQVGVQHVVGRQRVLVGLVRAQLGGGGLGQRRLRDQRTLGVHGPGQAINHGLRDVADLGLVACLVVVLCAFVGGVFVLVVCGLL